MRCDECQIAIEGYFDGELDEQTVLQVARHLEGCVACARLMQQLKAEAEVYVRYEPQVEIRPELWAQVQSRIVEKRPALSAGNFKRLQTWLRTTFVLPRVSGWATAALVVAAIGLTIIFMRYVRPGKEQAVGPHEQASQATLPAQLQSVLQTQNTELDRPKDKGVELPAAAARSKAPVRPSGPAYKSNTPDQLVREAEQKYLAAIAMLTRTVERKRSRLDAPTLARLEQSLASVDRTIAGTRKVVRQNPDDPVAVQYMLNAYSRKVDVLREVIGY